MTARPMTEGERMPSTCPLGMGDPSVDCAWPVCGCKALAALSLIEGEDEQATRAEDGPTAPTDRLQSKERSS